jgi:outer membrane lipoprotein-sorting protein
LCLVASACAARALPLPTDPGTPLPDFAEIHRQASSACAGVRTLTAELSLSGRAGGRALRGRAIVGFERPAAIRLEGVAPFGPPAFILAGSGPTATLFVPRDNRVLKSARAEDILGALTGVALSPADLLAVLTGCVVAMPTPSAGRMHQNGWVSIDLSGGATVYLERVLLGWQPRAARRPGWQIEYPSWRTGFPETVRLRSLDPNINVELTAAVSQLEANVSVDPAAFKIDVPADALSLSLDELRDSGPLREQ